MIDVVYITMDVQVLTSSTMNVEVLTSITMNVEVVHSITMISGCLREGLDGSGGQVSSLVDLHRAPTGRTAPLTQSLPSAAGRIHFSLNDLYNCSRKNCLGLLQK